LVKNFGAKNHKAELTREKLPKSCRKAAEKLPKSCQKDLSMKNASVER